VTEAFADDFQVHTGSKREARVSVPEIMQRDGGHAGPPDDPAEGGGYMVGAYDAAVLVGEDQAVIDPP